MKRAWTLPVAVSAVLAGGAVRIVQDQCGPFTDVSPAICPYVLEMYYLGITAGTSPTTYSPDAALTRGQAAVFVSKDVNQAIVRSSRRAALGQWWTTSSPHWTEGIGVTPFLFASACASDGADVWVSALDKVARVRASDGKLLENWTASSITSPLVAMGRVFVISPQTLWMIDPSLPPGDATVVATDLPEGLGLARLAFDGSRIWAANESGAVSIMTPSATIPWPVANISDGFTQLTGIAFDGANIWVSDWSGSVSKLDSQGAILQTVSLGGAPLGPVFDGANLWIPTYGTADPPFEIQIVRVTDGAVIAQLPIRAPRQLAFDGERIFVMQDATTNPQLPAGFTVYRAADLTPLSANAAPYPAGAGGGGVCGDGLNFWVAFNGSASGLGRF